MENQIVSWIFIFTVFILGGSYFLLMLLNFLDRMQLRSWEKKQKENKQ